MDMAILRDSLPAGLTVWKITNEIAHCQQRVDYEIVTPTFAASGNTQMTNVHEEEADVAVVIPLKKVAARAARVPTLLQQMAANIDELYCSLPPSMKRATESYLKEKIVSFVMSEEGNHVLGPKKCRECVAYLQTPMLIKCDAFFILCSFLLDAKIVVEHQVHTWNHQPYVNEVVLQCKN